MLNNHYLPENSENRFAFAKPLSILMERAQFGRDDSHVGLGHRFPRAPINHRLNAVRQLKRAAHFGAPFGLRMRRLRTMTMHSITSTV